MPYSYCVPGSATSGAAKISFDPDSTFGVPVASSQRTMSALKNQYARPLVCVTRWCTVARVVGGRSRGVSPSKPSSTCRSAKAGRYCSTGASRSSRPRSWS
jgi:hypothetical protein